MDKIVDRIRKLLALAGSSNENEATVAAEKAQELMAKHNIHAAEVAEKQHTALGVGNATVNTVVDEWHRQLASAIARTNGGRIVYYEETGGREPKGKIYFYAPEGIVESIIGLYEYLVHQLLIISHIETSLRSEKTIRADIYKRSFLLGAVSRLKERLELKATEMEQEGDNSKALVVIRSAVDAKVNEEHPYLTRGTTANHKLSGVAYSAGSAAAGNISLGERRLSSRRQLNR